MTELVKTATCASCGGGAGCQCGGTACSKGGGECQGGPLQRPLFFSGQLLTEDDLQLLSDYVATKSRLHNRFLHGDGVVCGLLVMCHPCGGGKVIVQAGTALDCCGNHIIVSCPVELDINEMVHALRIEKRGGYDCGDPCEKDCEDTPDDARCVERKGRRYCLYVRYCEEHEEPVAPYVSNGDCAVQVCKPTRIREGYSFELRCPEEERVPDNLWHRIRCCIGDLTRADKAAEDAVVADRYFRQTKAVALHVETGRVPQFQQADLDQLNTGIEALKPLQEAHQRRTTEREGLRRDGGEGSGTTDKEPDEEEVRRLLDEFQATASAVVRYDLQPADAIHALRDTQGAPKQVGTARALVRNTAERLRALSVAKLASARDRLIADTWISQGVHWTDPKLPPEQRSSRQQLQYAYNAPSSVQLQQQFSRDLGDLRDWLLERLDHKPLFSDCRLRRDVLAIDIPADTPSRQDAESSKRLVEALLRYLIECICAALNPPCQPCEDSAVKLACLTVDECEVISICNLERTFVLSAPAIRYWIPFLHTLGEAFERFCCDFRFKVKCEPDDEYPPASDPIFVRKQTFMVQTAPAYCHLEGEPQLTTLFRIARIDEKALRSIVNLGGNLAALATSDDDVYAQGLSLARGDIGRRITDAAVHAVVQKPQVRQALVGDVERELVALRRRVDEGQADEGAVETLVDRQVADRLQVVSGKMEQMLGEANRASAKTVKELKTALQEQEKRNGLLEKRLAKLEKGGG